MKKIKLPLRISSGVLAKHAQPGEPIVKVTLEGVGSSLSYEFTDREGRAYVTNWDRQMHVHVLKVPLSLWMQDKARLARDIMTSRCPVPRIPLFEMPEILAVAQPEPEPSPTPTPTPPQEDDDDGDDDNNEGDDKGDESTQEPTGEPHPLHAALAATVNDGPKRIKAVAQLIDAEEDTIKAAAEDPLSPVEIAQGGWVRLKAPPEPEQTPPAE